MLFDSESHGDYNGAFSILYISIKSLIIADKYVCPKDDLGQKVFDTCSATVS